jgi:hypothetical protein
MAAAASAWDQSPLQADDDRRRRTDLWPYRQHRPTILFKRQSQGSKWRSEERKPRSPTLVPGIANPKDLAHPL